MRSGSDGAPGQTEWGSRAVRLKAQAARPERPRVWRAGAVTAIVVVAAVLRGVYPLADPPSHAPVGVVWHDEGAWAHNARNHALFGRWVLDDWNPLFITPVLTGLERLSYAAFGVGLWQTRLVSEVMGVLSVLAMTAGMMRLAGPPAGAMAGALLATNYVYVMYGRAAVMEGTMVAWLVVAWWCYVRAGERPAWGLGAALAAMLAFFTKASAVFFLAALVLDSLVTLAMGDRRFRRTAGWTLGGLAIAALVAATVFVGPWWNEYRFYNWDTSVTRKPSYTLGAIRDRITWFPIVHDFFTRMWLVTILAFGGVMASLGRLRTMLPAERLLTWWIGLGIAELLARDVGNERYFVYLIPALVALAAIVLGRDRRLLASDVFEGPARRLRARVFVWLAPLLLFGLYVVSGAMVRLAFLYQVRPGVRWSAGAAAILTAVILGTWPRIPLLLARARWTLAGSVVLAALLVAGDLLQFAQWARVRTYKNYTAMRAIAGWLPPGTLVHGKLANGLALESAIKPIFVGRGFGNYRDRFARDDVPYVLTYVAPSAGYEGPVIREVIEAYPHRRILRRFAVSETPSGRDEAVLMEKWPGAAAGQPKPAGSDPERSVVSRPDLRVRPRSLPE